MSRSPAVPARLASKPSRRVSPTLSKKPSFVSAPALMNKMSSSFVVRNTPACQRPSLHCAAHAALERLRHDLLERRVRDERVRQAARIVLVGAGELDGGGRAARFAVARVERERVRADGDADCGIEPLERVVAVEIVLELVLEHDVRAVVASRHGQRRALAERERVAQVKARVRRRRLEARERFADEHAAGDGLPRLVERAELGARGELDVGVVVRWRRS